MVMNEKAAWLPETPIESFLLNFLKYLKCPTKVGNIAFYILLANILFNSIPPIIL